jgi:hypothetical protein
MVDGTLYDRLGVGPDADLMTLRAAYRHLALRLHPDLVAADAEGSATAAMALVNEAWRVLSDPSRRRAYDAALPRPAPPPTPTPTPRHPAPPVPTPTPTPGRTPGPTPGPRTASAAGAAPASPWSGQSGTPGARREAWLASLRLQVRRLGGQASRSASQTLAIRHRGVPRAHFDELSAEVLVEMLADTEDRVRQARLAGAAPLDLAIGAALLGLRVYADRLVAVVRAGGAGGEGIDVVHRAELIDRMWDTMAHEIPRELELALGGNPRATRRLR